MLPENIKLSFEKWCLENNPDMLQMWDYERNAISPNEVSYGATKLLWFKGQCGHSWESSPVAIRRGRGCPYCHGLKVLRGFNDLESKEPELAKEWHPTKNGKLKPSDVTYGSKQDVWWLSTCGHEWKAQINNRRYNRGCPICTDRLIIPGINDLASQYPELAKEWHPTKNKKKHPDKIAPHSNTPVWWLGPCGHEWKTQPNDRVNGSGCPVCKMERSTSFAEKAIAFYLSKITAVEESAHPLKSRKELDIYLPKLKIAVEYDGEAYHRSVEKDLRKNKECEDTGIVLIRIREPNCPPISDYPTIVMENRNDDGLAAAISKLIKLIFPRKRKVPTINLDQDRPVIYESYIKSSKENSLAESKPELIRYWNKKRNGALNPEYVNTYSMKKLWWICEKGHEWQATVANISSGSRCPYCSGHKVWKGFNDLCTTNPDIAALWSDKNTISPSSLSAGSHRKVWLTYPCGHESFRSVRDHIGSSGGSICNRKTATPGINDIVTKRPDLISQWDFEKNDLDPEKLRPGSKKKAWWVCEKGHSYQMGICDKSRGQNCPFCSGRRVLPGFNDIATTNPELLEYWDYEKNSPLEPTQINKGSDTKVWWKCDKGHTYQATIYNFSNYKNCPYCANRRILEGFNDLSTVEPEITTWWDYEKNGELLPTQVSRGSSRLVWWRCPNGHEYKKKIEFQVQSPFCPVCKIRLSRRS